MGFRHLNADEEQRWFLFFSWWHYIGWLNLIEYFSFKRKFNGPGWYDLHCGSVPKFLKEEFNQTGWKIKVLDHIPTSELDGTYTVKFEGNGKEGILKVDYSTLDYFRTSITIQK